jgi:hypothetical protein
MADAEAEECSEEDGAYWNVDNFGWTATQLGYDGGVGASHCDDGKESFDQGIN